MFLISQDEFISQRTPQLKKKGQESSVVNVKCITVIPDTFYPKWNKKFVPHKKKKLFCIIFP